MANCTSKYKITNCITGLNNQPDSLFCTYRLFPIVHDDLSLNLLPEKSNLALSSEAGQSLQSLK